MACTPDLDVVLNLNPVSYQREKKLLKKIGTLIPLSNEASRCRCANKEKHHSLAAVVHIVGIKVSELGLNRSCVSLRPRAKQLCKGEKKKSYTKKVMIGSRSCPSRAHGRDWYRVLLGPLLALPYLIVPYPPTGTGSSLSPQCPHTYLMLQGE